ncbi:MAG: M28 family peptidase [Chitinophagales bacterium]|nr:M28 family peptidase [Chitinophagales bacterium]
MGQNEPEKEKQFVTNARQLIYEGKRSGEGYFSPDGNYMIFQAEREQDNPFYQIYIVDLQSGDVNRVSPGYGKTTCSFFVPNSNQVIYASSHLDPKAKDKQKEEMDFRASGKKRRYSWDYEPQMDIFIANRDGSGTKRLTSALGYDAEGSVSPDGKKIVFCSNREAFNKTLGKEDSLRRELDPAYFGEIYIMDVDGSNQIKLTNTPGYDGGPFFSADGSRIIWRHFAEDGLTADVFTMKLDGSDVKRVTTFGAMSWAPYYHPSGDYIIFASNKLGFDNFELYLVDAAGTKEPIQISHTAGFDGLPVFTPDGKKLAWTSSRTKDGSSQIFMGNWNHAAALQALSIAPPKTSNSAPLMPPKAPESRFRELVGYFAADSLQGRMTGSDGLKKASNYAVQLFKQYGLQPLGKDYLLPFQFTAGVKADTKMCQMQMVAPNKKTYVLNTDYFIAPYSMNAEAEGNVVFAGYGIKTATGAEVSYNSYEGLDVKDKIVLVLDGLPDMDDQQRKQLVRYSSERYKTMVARELGAKAIIFITSSSQEAHEERGGASAGIVALMINNTLAENLIGTPIAKLKENLASTNPHVQKQFEIKNLKLKLAVKLDKVEKTDYNVAAVLKAPQPTDQYLLVGGHLDHLGFGETSSLASGEKERKAIHNGADDNASGSAMVIELARQLSEAAKKDASLLSKNVIFVLWSGEELGLVGSEAFTKNAPVPMQNIKAYINFDMVGRLKDNKLILQGLGSSTDWTKMVEKRNVAAGFDLVLQDDPYVPTDAMSLYQANVPVLCFFTGIHDDYHKPSDDADKINYEGMERIESLSLDIIKDLLKRTAPLPYAKVQMTASQTGTSRGFTVYLGTIPDYVAEVEGVKLSGVREGGPAERAGLKKDDIIIKLAGKDIKNVYDYTYVLGDLKAGEKIDISILRDGKQLTLEITPESK